MGWSSNSHSDKRILCKLNTNLKMKKCLLSQEFLFQGIHNSLSFLNPNPPGGNGETPSQPPGIFCL